VIDQHGVPLTERAATRILAGEPDGEPFEQERAERERFGPRPIDRVLVEHPGALLDHLL
jgi:hypothetical protein